jgi:hypothetical protein
MIRPFVGCAPLSFGWSAPHGAVSLGRLFVPTQGAGPLETNVTSVEVFCASAARGFGEPPLVSDPAALRAVLNGQPFLPLVSPDVARGGGAGLPARRCVFTNAPSGRR